MHGVSVHFVTEELDGGPVVIQARGAGPARTTPKRRFQREFSSSEHRIYPQAIDWFARGRLRLQDGRAWLDGQPLERRVIEPAHAADG